MGLPFLQTWSWLLLASIWVFSPLVSWPLGLFSFSSLQDILQETIIAPFISILASDGSTFICSTFATPSFYDKENKSSPLKEQRKNDCLISVCNRILQSTLEGKLVEEGSNNIGGKESPRSSGSVPRPRAWNSSCRTTNLRKLQRVPDPSRTMSSDAHLLRRHIRFPTLGGGSPPNMYASQPISIASRSRNNDRQIGTVVPIPAA